MAVTPTTQAEWLKKLKSFVPQWFFEEEDINEAYFQALALLLATVEQSATDHQKQTFICEAEDGYLDEHGSERKIKRSSGELNPSLAQRIKNISNTTSCPILKQIVDNLLDVGVATIVEDFDNALFFDRDVYYDRGFILVEQIYNAFSIVVDKQVHAPYSFYDREFFFDREDFIGRQESSLELFNIIIEAVNRSKALGTVYRLIERKN